MNAPALQQAGLNLHVPAPVTARRPRRAATPHWTPDAPLLRLIRLLELGDHRATALIDQDLSPAAALHRLGWTRIGHGAFRQVYAHAQHPVALKYGCPDANRTEWDVCQAACQDGTDHAVTFAVHWLSRHGTFLAMDRAETSLREAVTAGTLSGPEARRVARRLQDAGLVDCSEDNIGLFRGRWALLDASVCEAHLLETAPAGRAGAQPTGLP